jgi:rRNA biogenesis protein RRP5
MLLLLSSYVVDTGINGVISFLPLRRVPSSIGQLQLGQSVTCVVDEVNEVSRTVTLRIQKKAIAKAIVQSSSLSFLAIHPGMMFNVIVDKPVENGLIVNFLTSFSGVIDCFSLTEPMGVSQMKSMFSAGEVLVARIVFVDHATKSVRFSLRPHIIGLRAPDELPALGSILENLKVVLVQRQEGLLLTLASSTDEIEEAPEIATDGDPTTSNASNDKAKDANLGICIPRKKLEDPSTGEAVVENSSIAKLFKEGMILSQVRVLGYHLVEGWVTASNINHLLNQEQVLHISNIIIGQVYSAEITAIRPDGLVLLIEKRLPGFCPSLHLSDAGIPTKLSKLYRLHQAISIRVWDIDDKNIIASCKKSVLQEDVTGLLTSYEDAVKGRLALGIVSKLSADDGIRVHFCSGIKGYVPNHILTKQGIFDLAESYQVGQAVQCMIIDRQLQSENTEKKPRLVLAFAIGDVSHLIEPDRDVSELMDVDGEIDQPQATAADGYDVISGHVIKVEAEELSLRLSDGRAAIIPKHQCFDFSSTAEKLFQTTFSVGSYLPQVLVLANIKKTVLASIKPLFLKIAVSSTSSSEDTPIADSPIPSSIADLVPGLIVVGWVFRVESYGVLIRFRGNLTALAPRTCLADKFVSSPIGMFSVGDSMRCIVQKIDPTSNRVIVMLKPTLVPSSAGRISYCRAYLSERFLVGSEVAKQSNAALPDWKTYALGSIIEAKVAAIDGQTVRFIGSDGSTMMKASREHLNVDLSSIQVNAMLRVRVLDIDYENNSFVVSCLPHLTTEARVGKKKQAHKNITQSPSAEVLELNIKLYAKVEAVCEKYLIVSVEKNTRQYLVFVSNVDYNAPSLSTSAYKVNSMVDVSIDIAPSSAQEDPYQAIHLGHVVETAKEFQLQQSAAMREEAKAVDAIDYGKLKLGSIIPWKITEIGSLEIKLKPAVENSSMNSFASITGSLHLSCAVDQIIGCDDISSMPTTQAHPFDRLQVGSRIYARVMKVQMVLNKDKARARSSSIFSESSHPDDKEEHEETADPSKDSIFVYVSIVQQHQRQQAASQAEDEHKTKIWRPLVQWQTFGRIQLHHIYAAAVSKIDKFSCMVALSPYISVKLNYMDVSSDPKIIQHFIEHCYIGQRVLVMVTALDAKRKHVQVRRIDIEAMVSLPYDEQSTVNLAKQSSQFSSTSAFNLKKDSIVYGLLDLHSKMHRSPAASIHLPGDRLGRLCITEIDDYEDWCDDYLSLNSSGCNEITSRGLAHGQLVTCYVIELHEQNSEESASNSMRPSYEVSLRPSRLAGSASSVEVSDAYPAAGTLIKGYIVNISNKGCFVRLSHNILGHVLMRDLADGFLEDPSSSFPTGKLVTCRVISSNPKEDKVQLSLKPSAVEGDAKILKELSQLRVKQVVTGSVHKVTEFGVFVAIDGTSLIGLSRMADALLQSSGKNKQKTQDLREVYAQGDVVRAKILSITPGSNKISLGLKPSYFRHNDSDSDDDSDEEDEEADTDEEVDIAEESPASGALTANTVDEVVVNTNKRVETSVPSKELPRPHPHPVSDKKTMTAVAMVEDHQPKKKLKAAAVDTIVPTSNKPVKAMPANSASSLIEWDDFAPPTALQSTAIASMEDDDAEDDDLAEGDGKSTNHRSRQKDVKRRREEQLIRAREEALTEGNLIPENKDDYERLLLAQPNSSFLWIQYMAYHLASADTAAARAIAERALRIINFREEDEKLNVWLAWLNLEYKFGSAESIDQVYRRAVNESHGKHLHLRLAESLEVDQRDEQCAEILEKALKKYKYSKKVWMAYQHHHLRKQRLNEAKALLARSMQSLAKHKHVEVIMKFALCEYEVGLIHDGRYLFEELLMSYPKRSDLWHVYVDREIKHGDYSYARQIFERMIAAKTSVRNMKVIFKKYLEFEQKYGNVSSQEAVKQKAREYVESLMS